MTKLDAILDLPGQALSFFLNKWKLILSLTLAVVLVGLLYHFRALKNIQTRTNAAATGVPVQNKKAVYEKEKRAIDNINAMPDSALQREIIRVFGN